MPHFTTRSLLAQCMMPRISSDDYYDAESGESRRKALHSLIQTEGIGGVCVFAGNALETAQMLKELQTTAARAQHPPLLVSADFEHGVAMRLSGGTAFPHAMALGMADNTTMTENVGRAIALEAAMLGVHWNFAPVADVNANKHNPIINIRAFGETPDVVSRHAEAYIRGTQLAQVLSTAKHFPGHGDTQSDSHLELPTLPFDRTRLDTLELAPFRAAIAAGVRSVMVGHLAIPALESDAALPASLSHNIMTGLLREELGFAGIVVTDALDMKAITNHWSVEQSAVMAFAGGADVVLLPPDPLRALNALELAVTEGRISLKKVFDSAQRILEAKQWCGLLTIEAESAWHIETLETAQIQRVRRRPDELPETNKQDQSLLALDAAKPALRWFGDTAAVQSLERFQQIAGFALVEERDIPAATNFFRYLAQLYRGDCDFAFVDADIEEQDIAELLTGTQDAEIIVFAVFVRAQAERGSIALPKGMEAIAKRLANGKPSLAVLFGNPYLRETFPASAFLCTYSSSEPALGAAASALVAVD
jgi:beta-N-acetylhexosaminidase